MSFYETLLLASLLWFVAHLLYGIVRAGQWLWESWKDFDENGH